MKCYNCKSENVSYTTDGTLAICDDCGVMWEWELHELQPPKSSKLEIDWKPIVMLVTVVFDAVILIIILILAGKLLSGLPFTVPTELTPWHMLL